MDENELKKIIYNLWISTREDSFRTYLWEHGYEPKEIDNYINKIKNIIFKGI